MSCRGDAGHHDRRGHVTTQPEALDELLGALHQAKASGDLVRAREIRARYVIMAANAPFAAPLVGPVAPQAADALAKLTYGAFLSVAVETNETSAMPYDGVYAIATPGRTFDMFTNQAHALRVGPRRPGGSLMLFTGAQKAAARREIDVARELAPQDDRLADLTRRSS